MMSFLKRPLTLTSPRGKIFMTQIKWFDLSKLNLSLKHYQRKDNLYLFVLMPTGEVRQDIEDRLLNFGFRRSRHGYVAPMKRSTGQFIASLEDSSPIEQEWQDTKLNLQEAKNVRQTGSRGVRQTAVGDPSGGLSGDSPGTGGSGHIEGVSSGGTGEDTGGSVRPDNADTQGQSGQAGSELLGEGPASQLGEESSGAPSDQEEVTSELNPRHFFITDEITRTSGFSAKKRYNENKDAILTLKDLETSERDATEEEKQKLVKFNGWGGLSRLFDDYSLMAKDQWEENASKEISEILEYEEKDAAAESTPNSFYTSPEVIRAIWREVKNQGFRGGRVLEPSMGSGSFFGLADEKIVQKSSFVGIEKENLAGRIAQKIYPDAKIHVKGFEEVQLPDNFFDLALTNVPFGDYRVYDPVYQKHKMPIHDYFIVKTLDKLKPNGIFAVLTSAHTMNKKSNYARKLMADRADLIEGFRLPSNSQKDQAGAEVTEDLLFFRKRTTPHQKGEEYPDWVFSEEQMLPDKNGNHNESMNINKYFRDNPEKVLGNMYAEVSLYGAMNVVVDNDRPLHEIMEENFVESEKQEESEDYPDLPLDEEESETDELTKIPHFFENSYFIDDSKAQVCQVKNDKKEKADFRGKSLEKVTLMIRIKDAMNEVFDAQKQDMDGLDSERYLQARQELNDLYDDFVSKFGPINKRGNISLISDDPAYGCLASLEHYSQETQTAQKADIFFQKVIAPPKTVESVETPYEGLLVSLNETGKVDLSKISYLCGDTLENVQKNLSDAGEIFYDPTLQKWQTSTQYLSGDVRYKLRQAQAAVEIDPYYQRNIEALQEVIPADLEPKDIEVRLGAPWIPEEDVKDFVCHCLNTQGRMWEEHIEIRRSPLNGTWEVSIPAFLKNGLNSTSEYGTPRRPFSALLEHALNQKQPKVYDTVEDEEGNTQRVFNYKETVVAQEKMDVIQQEFRRFIWEDDVERAERLLKLYNETYNNIVPPKYSGNHLTFPGMSLNFKPRPHQADAVWRCLQNNTLLGHSVGTGKTFVQVATAMEMKRLGRANKPLMVVPNSMLEQINREAHQFYPDANILMVTKKDLNKNNRRKLVGKIANNNWDLVVLTHSMFESIRVEPEFEKNLINEQISAIKEEMRNSSTGTTQKGLAKKVKNLENKLKELGAAEKKDDGIYMDDLGIDALIVDEAHNFKNLQVVSSSSDLQNTIGGSQKAFDLFMKTQWLYSSRNEEFGVVFASGTPVTNNPLEIYNMQRYLQPRLLEKANIHHATSWVANFMSPQTTWEPSHTGLGWKQRTRNKLLNLPELMQFFRMSLDVVTSDDANIKAPEAERVNIVSPLSDLQQAWMEGLDDDLQAGDHVFRIMHKGRHLALDPRTLDPDVDVHDETKVKKAAECIFREWEEYHDISGVQLVFCDISTPKKDQFNVYDELKNELAEKGIPESQIAYIHDYPKDSDKAKLFRQVREGDVRILMGSTSKMGEGLNIQDKATCVHNLDAPWTPAAVMQRTGRVVREGNINSNVRVYIYTAEDTFDLFQWNLLRLKEDQFSRVLKGDTTIRTYQMEIDPTYAETAAVTSGNPFIKEKLEVDQEISRLESLAKSHSDNVYKMKLMLKHKEEEFDNHQIRLNKYEAIPSLKESPDIWRIEMKKYGFEKDFQTEDRNKMLVMLRKIFDSQQLTKVDGITCGGLPISVTRSFNPEKGTFNTSWNIEIPENQIRFRHSKDVCKILNDREGYIQNMSQKVEGIKQEISSIKEKIETPFEHKDKLNELYARQREIDIQISEADKPDKKEEDEEGPNPDSLLENYEGEANSEEFGPASHVLDESREEETESLGMA